MLPTTPHSTNPNPHISHRLYLEDFGEFVPQETEIQASDSRLDDMWNGYNLYHAERALAKAASAKAAANDGHASDDESWLDDFE